MFKRLNNLPVHLHHKGFYYGWVVLFAGTLGVIMSVPGQTMGVSVYTDHLLKTLEIDRSQLSLAYLCGTIASSFLLPLAGRLLDKLGSRVLGTLAASGLGFFILYIALSPNIKNSIVQATSLNPTWVALLVMFFGFMGIRHFGQGQLTMASRTMMGLWFEKRRGLVLGISGLFVAFGFGLAPVALTQLIEIYHWQKSLYILAGLSLLMAVFAWATYRRSPEHSGLEIDGGLLGSTSLSDTGDAVKPTLKSLTATEAKRTVTFWIFNLGMVAQALLITGVVFHMAHIGKLNGLDSVKAFSVFLPIAVISTIADLVGGYLSDKIPLKYLLTVMQMGICLGLLGLRFYGTDLGFMTVALGFGISNGLFSLLTGAAWPKLFGRAHLGSIAGVSMSWMVFGSAIGPYLLSFGTDSLQELQTVLAWCILFPFSLVLASFFANQPVRS